MAELVQSIMDGMVPALHDLMERGFFSQDEIRAIVDRRQESEYEIHRRMPRQSDFLRYAQAEIELEKLRSLRHRRLMRETGGDLKPGLGDASIVRHIHFIYHRATWKFKSDLSIYLQHAAFAKTTGAHRRLGKIYASALQIHPRNTSLWIEAASLEYFGWEDDEENGDEDDENKPFRYAGSIKNARVLMQRGLRVNPHSKDMYLQFFLLEWHYVQKLRGRKEIMDMRKNIDTEEAINADDKNEECVTITLYEGSVPIVIYNQAIDAIPHDLSFRFKFLDACKQFPQTRKVVQRILSSIKQDFSKSPMAMLLRATYLMEHNSKKLSSEHLKEALELVHSSESAVECTKFLKKKFDEYKGTKFEEVWKLALRELFEIVQDRSDFVEAPELSFLKVQYLMDVKGELYSAEQLLRDSTINSINSNADLWLQYACLIERINANELRASFEPGLPQNAIQILKKATEQVSMSTLDYHKILMSHFHHLLIMSSRSKYSTDETSSHQSSLSILFTKILLYHKTHTRACKEAVESFSRLCLAYLRHASLHFGLEAARGVCDDVLRSLSINDHRKEMDPFFHACISLEKCDVVFGRNGKKRKSETDEQKNTRLKRIYDDVLKFYCKDIDMYNKYKSKKDSDTDLLQM